MSKKIPNDYNDVIYEEYESLLAVGVPITRIADLINEKLGTNFPESSLRGRYKDERNLRTGVQLDDEEYEQKLLMLAKADIKLRHERKLMNKERAIVEGLIRESAENLAVSEAIIQGLNKEPTHYPMVHTVAIKSGKGKYNGYAYGDVHLGYEADLPDNYYDIDIAIERLNKVYSYIADDALANGYKEVFISDHGDDIEGSALRVSQLTRIAADMTEQATIYGDALVERLKWLCKQLPDVKITFLLVSSDNHSELRLYGTKRGDLTENMQMVITNKVESVVDTAHEFGAMGNLKFIHGDEIVATFNDMNVAFIHGHQYGRNDNILEDMEHTHGVDIHGYIAGHWHLFSVKYRNIKKGFQQALIHLPAVVGNTDFSEKIHKSAFAGFAKITIDTERKFMNAEFISLQ